MTAIRAFGSQDIDAAAALLTARHQRHRGVMPLLGSPDTTDTIRAAFEAADGGLVQVDASGTVHAYLLWQLRETDVWGRFAWVDRAGHAATDREVTRDLYAAAADDWVADGVVKHAVVVPATSDDLDPWERLGFARMQVHALRRLPDGPAGAPDARIRPSGIDDLDHDLPALASLIWEHQARSPVFTGLTAPTWEQHRPNWLETLEEDGAAHVVAEVDGRIAGHALIYPADDEFGWPDRTVRLAVVAVLPDQRGRGLGRALTDAVFDLARAAGHEHVETDWRVTNLLASRTWPAVGFVPVFHRLWRVVGTG